MNSARLIRLALLPWLVALTSIAGCRLDNPAFGDEVADVDTGTSKDTGSEGLESGSSHGDTTSADTSTSSSDGSTSSSSDGSTSSSDGSTSDGSTSSSDGSTSSSDGSTSDTSSDGLDGPIMSCPLVEPAETCLQCMQNECCIEADLGCFDGLDPKCTCTLACLAEGGGDACAVQCGAGQLPANHAEMIYTCGLDLCANLCSG